jgi:hypothetical protein
MTEDTWRPSKKQSLFLGLPFPIKEAAYAGGAGSGKALALDTIIPTPEGYKTIQDIHPGDFVYNHEGKSTIVWFESEIFIDYKCYKITFDSGISVIADADHLWIVHKNQLTRNKLSTYQILKTSELFSSPDKWSIIVSEPLEKEDWKYPIDPYTLGVWLGDGSTEFARFTGVDDEIVSRVGQVYELSRHNTGDRAPEYGIFKILGELRDLNLLGNKHIPELYYNLEFDARLALLQGLMDTDGTVNPNGSGIELSLSDEKLALDSLKLIRSLGIKAHCSVNKSVLNGQNYKDRYRIGFATKVPVFSLSRKSKRHDIVRNKDNNNTTRNKWHYINTIEEVETVPTKCLQVDGGVYLVTEACIPTHNTDLLLLYGIIHKFHEHPRFKQLFLRRTYPEIRDEIIPRTRRFYKPFGAKLNQSTMTWTFPSGARIILGHCEDEQDVHRYDSTEINLFTPDEITSFTEYQYLYIGFTRVRSSDSTLPAIIRCCGMPGNIGHTWFRNRFVKPCPEGGKVIIGKGGNKRIYIFSTLLDNPGIDPNYRKSLEALPEAEKRAKLYGDWDAFQGSVFDEFRDRHYPEEPENALHVIEPFNIPEWWPRIVIGDWGFAAMTWIGFAAISPSKRVYIYRELYWTKTRITDWAAEVREFIDKESPKLIRFCKSAGQDRGQEHTIQQQISEALGREIELSDNKPGSRVAGKMLIHEYLRWKSNRVLPPTETLVYDEELALRVLRVGGEVAHKKYTAQFTPIIPENNIPKLQIFSCCPTLIEAIKACSYDERKVEDIKEFSGDDPIDGLRYLVDAVDGYVTTAQVEMNRIQKEEELIRKVTESNDWTAFYRQAKRLDSDRVVGVRRYH